ncbi:MAG TPA: hypothetical protein VIU61_25865 [Kofleriaceae bacterium]
MRRLALLVLFAACGDKEQKPAPVPTEPAPPTEAELRAQNTLAIVERAGTFEIRDAAGSVTLALPAKPTLVGEVMTQGGQRAFQADATLRGALDIQFGVLTMQDRVLPAEVVKTLDAAPFEIAKEAGGGDIQRNMKGTLAGHPAHLFELVTPDQRRILGWYIPQASRGRLIQLHCSGPEGDATRVGCDGIAATLTVAK